MLSHEAIRALNDHTETPTPTRDRHKARAIMVRRFEELQQWLDERPDEELRHADVQAILDGKDTLLISPTFWGRAIRA